MADWKADLSNSSRAFLDCVWPVINEKCGGGNIKPVEVLHDNDLAKDLDILCGIDVWQTIDGEGARGIASRVQFGQKNWQTFTIRRSRFNGSRTEYDKRLEAIQSGGRFIYPYLTCQAYVYDGALVGVGLAKTVDIFSLIEREKADGRAAEKAGRDQAVWINKTTNADFYCVRFDAVENCWTS